MNLNKTQKLLTNFLIRNFFIISVFLSILIGFIIGLLTRQDNKNVVLLKWLTLPGELFLRALKLIIVPILFVGVINATSTQSPRNNLKISLVCIGFIALTHILSSLIGLLGCLSLNLLSSNQTLSAIIPQFQQNRTIAQKDLYDIAGDILRNMIPKNLIKAATNQEMTKFNGQFKRVEYIEGSNILGLLTFSILIGVASSILPKSKSKMFRQFFKSCNEVLSLAMKWIIYIFSPLGIGSLIIEAVHEVKDFNERLRTMALFALICVSCLIFYGFFVLSFMSFLFTRKNPFKMYLDFFEAALLAFASTSGAVCMPKSIEICNEKLKMDKRFSEFTIPFYTALQSDGNFYIIS
jgi:solute carrier family 1 (high affinity glutamate transporter) protein 2